MSASNERETVTDSGICTGDPLARALAELEPMPQPLNRDQLMFAAGSASRDRAVTFWKRIVYGQATAACLLVGIGLSLPNQPMQPDTRGAVPGPMADSRSTPASRPKPMQSPVPPTVTATNTVTEHDNEETSEIARYLQLRANVLTLGVNALPNSQTPTSTLDVNTLEDSLQLPRGTFAIHGLPTKKSEPKNDEPLP